MPSFAKSLSLHRDIQPFAEYAVTPFVGVWIETFRLAGYGEFIESHPSWVCGLKPGSAPGVGESILSHPSWVCGLKLVNYIHQVFSDLVTPFVGVWIET